MNWSILNAALGVVLSTALGVMAITNSCWKNLSAPEHYFDGSWTKSLEPQFEKGLLAYTPSLNVWTAVTFAAFGEGRPGVLIGSRGWLYSREEFDATEPSEGIRRTIQFANRSKVSLAKRGVRLVVVLIPAKARIYPEHLGWYRWPSSLKPVYDTLRDGLRADGIDVVDLSKVYQAKHGKEQVYLRTDTHWTPAGARLAANELAEMLGRAQVAGIPGTMLWAQRSAESQSIAGDLLNYLPLGDQRYVVAPPSDKIAVNSFAPLESGDLFSTAANTPMVLVGSSYSADPRWGFADQIRTRLHIDLVNASEKGKGPFDPLKKALRENVVGQAQAGVLVWELPERYVWQAGPLGPPK